MGFTEDWDKRVAADYQASVERGKHDEQCEFDVRGFYLCHCSKRRREAKGFTKPPTENLEFPPPYCARCDEELVNDGDGWACYGCALFWDYRGNGPAVFTDDFGDDLAGDAERWRAKRAEYEAERSR